MSSPADILARKSGVKLRDVARRWPSARARMTEREIQNRIAYIRRAARHGNLHAHAGAMLANHLRCDPQIFLWGYAKYLESLAPQESSSGSTGGNPTGAIVNTRRTPDGATVSGEAASALTDSAPVAQTAVRRLTLI